MAGTMGQTKVIPGIGGTGLPADMRTAKVNSAAMTDHEHETVALFTNPQGVFNNYSGTTWAFVEWYVLGRDEEERAEALSGEPAT